MTHHATRARAGRSLASAQKKSRTVMRASAATAELEALAELANRRVRFPPALWEGVPDEYREHDLKVKYRKGALLREGVDYNAAGHCAYAVEGSDDLALVLCEEGSEQRVPAAYVIEGGYYTEDGVAYPAILMKRYTSTSTAGARRSATPEE